MTLIDSFTHLSDEQLVGRVRMLADDERRATVALIAALAEFDVRKLYLAQGCSSLFTYCTQVLHLSEHAPYGRIEAARAVRRFPILLDQLADGALTLTTMCLLVPHLTEENQADVRAAMRGKSKRDVQTLLAGLHPQPAVPASVRKLPVRTPIAPSPDRVPCGGLFERKEAVQRATERNRSVVAVTPLAPERFRLQLTLSADGHNQLRRAQDLLRHSIPNGDPAAIVERALTVLVQDLERTKFAATLRPQNRRATNTRSRHIPAAVRRAVWRRDGGRCAFVGTQGRCTERGFLEFHHLVPYADGGEGVVENLELRCRAHNAYEAGRWHGTLFARESGVFGCISSELGPDRAHGAAAGIDR